MITRRLVIIIVAAVVLGFWISSRITDHTSSQSAGLEDSAACTVSKIVVDKLRAQSKGYGYFRITGRLTNNCDQPTGVQIKVTVCDKADNILASPDLWPASVSNIPAHSEYPFECLQEAPGFHRFTVNVINVRTW
jgi:maltose-binding protein MalE